MPHKKDVPPDVYEELMELHRRLRLNSAAPTEVKTAWYHEVRGRLKKRGADLAWAFVEANIPLNQVNQYFSGVNTVAQNTNPGGTNTTQIAGGNQTGVNATGTQTIRDINVWSQDLDQTGAAINRDVRSALTEARRSIHDSGIDDALKPTIIEQFDKLTEELKKGDNKNPGVVKMLWNMVYGAIQSAPAVVTAFDKLKDLLGF